MAADTNETPLRADDQTTADSRDAGKPGKGTKPSKAEKPQKAAKPPKAEKPPKAAKTPKAKKPPRAAKPPKAEKPPRAAKPPKGEKPVRPEKPEIGGKAGASGDAAEGAVPAGAPARPSLPGKIALLAGGLPVRKLLVVFSLLFLALLVALGIMISRILSTDVVVSGVYIEGRNVSGLGREELLRLMEEMDSVIAAPVETEAASGESNAGEATTASSNPESSGETTAPEGGEIDARTIELYHQKWSMTVSFADLGIEPDREAMAEHALSLAHEGGPFAQLATRMALMKAPVEIRTIYRFNGEKMDGLLKAAYDALLVPTAKPALTITEERTTLSSGTGGQTVDTEALHARIMDVVHTGRTGVVHVPVVEPPMPQIDAEQVYEAILREPADAAPVPDAEKGYVIRPAVSGRTIDKAKLREIVASMNARSSRVDEAVELPVVYVRPKLSLEQAEALAFKTALGESRTSFETATENDRNRAINIRLAAEAIDGALLWPGMVFSFNQKVGERTAEAGYVSAHAYAAGGVIDEIGGGICQVSSTLLNAALTAGIAIEERHPHTFAVSYASYGRDAAVSWKDLDLKIVNEWEWPVRIDAKVGASGIRVAITGADLHPNFRYTVYTKTLSTVPMKIERTEDPTLPEGEERLIEAGFDGAVVETRIKEYDGESLLNQYTIFTSEYQPFPERRRIGTGQAVAPAGTGEGSSESDTASDSN